MAKNLRNASANVSLSHASTNYTIDRRMDLSPGTPDPMSENIFNMFSTEKQQISHL